MAQASTLHDAFLDELRDIYHAEKQITKALPKMVTAASDSSLAKAFSDLSSQSVSLECDVNIEPSGTSAKASCRGTTSYVRKVGNREPRTEPRTVQFELKRDGEVWRIQKAQTGR